MKSILSTLLLAGLLGLPAMASVSARADASYLGSSGDIVFEFPDAELGQVNMQGQQWSTVEMEGCITSLRPGEPALPLIARFVEIPDRSDVRFVLVDADYVDLPLDAPVLPQLERVHSEQELPLPFLYEEEAYRSNQYPTDCWQMGDPVLLRNHRLVKLQTFPVQIRDTGETLRVYSRIVLRPVFEGENLINQRTRRIQSAGSSMDRAIQSQIVNRDVSQDEAMRDIFDERVLPGNYLFIAYDETITNDVVFNNFVDWKRGKGHHVTIATASDIGGGMGADDIQGYIENAYFNWEYPPEFVLLFGDAESSASDFSIPAGPGGSYDGQQDHYYACVDGSDFLGDVVVGRISVENINQLRAVLRKTMYYEQTPTANGIGDDWLAHAALSVGHNSLSMRQQSRSITIDLVEHGYDQIDTTWSSSLSWVSARYNEGISFYNYRGWVGMNGVDAYAVDDDSNFDNDFRTPITVIFTCGTGDFNQDYSTTEAFLRKGDAVEFRGGVCALGFCTIYTHTAYNNAVVGGFWSGALDFDIPQVGTDMFMGKYTLYLALDEGDGNAEDFANRANLMGDPGIDMWIGRPDVLNVSSMSSIPYGAEYFEVDVDVDGAPLENAVVCLYDADTGFQEVCATDASGRAVLALDGLTTGDVTLTVTKPQHLPVISSLNVTQATASATVTSAGIQGDGIALQGETVSLRPVLENIGSQTLSGLSGSISVDLAWGTVVTGATSWSNLSSGASAASTSSLVIQLSDELVSGQELMIPLSVSSIQGTYEVIIPLQISAPALLTTDMTFTPGGGAMTTGVPCQMALTLANTGDYTANGLEVTLIDTDAFVLVQQGSASLGTLGVGADGTAVFTLLAEDSYGGYEANLQLNWSTSDGLGGSLPVSFNIGHEDSFSPTGPDGYGYRIYEDIDANTESPAYNWIGIAPEEGGTGTLVPLTDTANEGDDAVLLDLPFDFVFYGESFDQLGVCSNGFVAFGPLGHLETDFRNHHLPCGLGPDYMLAPMWDDFIVDASGQVYTKHLAAEGIFVIEWYNTQFNGYSNDRNTFQILLYDPLVYPTATGDGEIVFQYADFNNTQDNNTDFPFCTIGMKNGDSTDGLMITHFDQWVSTATEIADGRAIKITTDLGYYSDEDLVAPSVVMHQLDVAYNTYPLEISAEITDISGVLSAALHYRSDTGEWQEQAMAWSTGDTYSTLLPLLSGGTTLEFYITAIDASEYANERVTTTRSIQVFYDLGHFEMNAVDGWTHSDGPSLDDEWHLETARSHSGGTSWKFGGNGNDAYGSSAGGILLSPVIPIPSGATDLQISFWSWMESETSPLYPDSCYDGGVVEISMDGGAWQSVNPVSGFSSFLRERSPVTDWFGFPRQMFAGEHDWQPYSIPLSGSTSSLQVRFMFASDGAVHYEGWYVDDLRVAGLGNVAAPDPVALQISILPNSQVRLDWSASEFAVGYRVYAGMEPYEAYTLIHTTEETSFTLPLASDYKFFYVKAMN